MPRTCFVLMPFDGSFQALWETVIRRTVVAHGDSCFRADDIYTPGVVINDVFRSIREADYLIADVTHRKPNVMYELGYAQALDKVVVIIAQDFSDIPFDLQHQRAIIYEDSVAGSLHLKSELSRYLLST